MKPKWWLAMSRASRARYLKEHPNSRMETASVARKLVNNEYVRGAVNTGLGIAAEAHGLGNLDAAREGRLPRVDEERPSKRKQPARAKGTRDQPLSRDERKVMTRRTSGSKGKSKSTAERVREAKARQRKRK